jgi:putative transcription factor
MQNCNICGEQEGNFYVANIEGAELIVCENCAKLGKVIKRIEEPKIEKKQKTKDLSEEDFNESETSNYSSNKTKILVPDYGKRVKQAREKKDLKQKELAKMLAIKESLLHNIESNHFEPSDDLIQKLEKFLHIKLMQEVEDKPVNLEKRDSGTLTLGDMIKIKKK